MSRSLTHAIVFACVLTPAILRDRSALVRADGEEVKITTVDGVELKGKFWTGKPQYAVALLLHDYNSDSRTKDWVNLAEELNKKGLSVLAFDFRGHGQSTEVQPALFWSHGLNLNRIKNAKAGRTSIEVKEFKPEYRPVMINDIAAAKAFLDRKNDAKVCNSGATILIGAGEGATLGVLWLQSDWYRYRLVPNMFGAPVQNPTPEGKDVVACIWLSISPKLGSFAPSLAKLHYLAGKTGATPMVFMHGDGDTAGKKTAKDLADYLKKDPKDKERLKYTGPYVIKGTKLTGAQLLRSETTIGNVTDWIKEVVLAKAPEYTEREFRKTPYIWNFGGTITPARTPPTEMNMAFDSYEKFILR